MRKVQGQKITDRGLEIPPKTRGFYIPTAMMMSHAKCQKNPRRQLAAVEAEELV